MAHDDGLFEAMKYRPIGVHATRAARRTLKRTWRVDSAVIAPIRTSMSPTLIERMIHTECSTLCPAKR